MSIRRVNVIQYGLGTVGRALLGQVLAGREVLAARQGLELRHVAVADSAGLVADPQGLAGGTLREALEAKAEGRGLGQLAAGRHRSGAEPLALSAAGPTVVVDVTAAEGMEAVALDALGRGWGAVLANKRPLAGRLATFRRLTAGPRLRLEATIGAGLPWIEALGHLLATGDRVLCVEAAVSGTLGFIFSELEAGASFSAAVAEARARGYTEPDPRDDLGAADVRRKALILARLLGLEVEWGDVPAEPLYPGTWDELSVERFMAELPALDAEYGAQMATARAASGTLRYAVEIRDGRCTAGLRQLTAGSPLASLQGAECLLAITSQRYRPLPLVIRGPGAGAEVTAAGVYADIIALGMEL